MILKRILSEAKVTDEKKQLSFEIKQKDQNLNKLRDTTINNIITIFKKDSEETPTCDNVIDWFNLSGSFGDFVFDYGSNLSTYSISDFAENDPKLARAIKDYLISANIMDENNVDLTLAAEDGKRQHKMNVLEQCITAIDEGTSREESLKGIKEFYDKLGESLKEDVDASKVDLDKIIGWISDHDDLYDDFKNFFNYEYDESSGKETNKPSKEKVIDWLSEHDQAFDDFKAFFKLKDESLNEEHVCEKCGHSPCICEEEGEDIPAPEGVTFDLSNGEGEPEEVTIKAEEPSEQVQQNAFSDLINAAIQKEWDIISQINSLIATFDFEYKDENKDDITAILNQLVDDSTINVGMLHKVAELVSTKTSELLDSGEEKAEEIISEPAKDLE